MARKPSRNEWRQSKKGLWTRSLGTRGVRIRLFQKRKEGVFYRSAWIPNRGEDRKCLGTSDRAEAERMGNDLLAALLRSDRIESSGALPLGYLWEKYSGEAVQFLDNHERTRQEAAFHAAVLIGYFGENCDVRDLTQQDQLAFAQKRLAGGISYRLQRGSQSVNEKTKAVRTRAAEVEVKLLHAMLRWATTVRLRSGARMLEHNPLAGIKTVREVNPKRPVTTWERFQSTCSAIRDLYQQAGDDVERRKWCKLEMALVLAEATGRRLGSIRCLSWSDIDLTSGTIRWRAEHDKKGRDWLVPIPESLRDELRAFRVRAGGGFGGLCFPCEHDGAQPIRTDILSQWLCQAERKAGLVKLDGGLWHPYRRAWATSRKHLPATDVMAVGGWSDVNTLLRCYQHADTETMLSVMSESRKVTERANTG